MDYSTLAAVIVGLLLKHVVAPNWSGFSTKAIPIIIFLGSFIYQLMAQLGLPLPTEGLLDSATPVAAAAGMNTILASGTQSVSKNVLAQWALPGLFGKKGRK